jgi:hypothetical protein
MTGVLVLCAPNGWRFNVAWGPVFPYLQKKLCSAANRCRPDTISTPLFVGSN